MLVKVWASEELRFAQSASTSANAGSASDRLDLNRRGAGEAERMRAGRRQIDNATAHERAAIINPHDHATPIAAIDYAHARAEGQRAMRRR